LRGWTAGLLGWAVGALFIPSPALVLGIWSGASKFFEGLYTLLWYIGPLNQVPGLDFTGNANGPQAGRIALIYWGIAAMLVAAAFFGRGRQLRGT